MIYFVQNTNVFNRMNRLHIKKSIFQIRDVLNEVNRKRKKKETQRKIYFLIEYFFFLYELSLMSDEDYG